MTRIATFTAFALALGTLTATAQPKPTTPPPKASAAPVSADPRLVVELFAAAPDIVHPIAATFDARDRLLVIESHTHFATAKYAGPKHDRIRILEDTNGDGKADRITTYFEGTTATMDIAAHPDGSIYIATRNELIRLRDTNGDGKADEKTRIAFLDTAGTYPHNGLCGIAFDSKGDVYFGLGENFGAPYKLTGTDGTTLTGDTEGGNLYHCTADGKKLRRISTGYWNPFGTCVDIFGRLFAVDNDPDASPPCRLVQVVDGSDFGYQFHYGRAGRHPFQAWNGELPGTLPYMSGTGESPCEVVSYESDGLPAEYRGDLLVPAWADHRIERYVTKPRGASFAAERKPFITGGKEFRPSGLVVAPDGSLFVMDWVSQSYETHGQGAIWHVRMKDAKPQLRPKEPKAALLSLDRPTREAAAQTLAKDQAGREFLRKQLTAKDVRIRAAALTALVDANDDTIDLKTIARTDPEVGIRAMAVRALASRGIDVSEFAALHKDTPPAVRYEAIIASADAATTAQSLTDNDPFIRHAAVRRLARKPDMLSDFTTGTEPKSPALRRMGILLGWRASERTDYEPALKAFLADPDPDVRFLAVKWVADKKLAAFRPQIAAMLKAPNLDPRGFLALTTALARIDGKPVNEDGLAGYFLDRLKDPSATAAARLMALRAIPATHKKVATEQFTALLSEADPAFRIEALRAIKDRADPKAAPPVRALAGDAQQPAAVRAQAILTLSALVPVDVGFLTELAGSPDDVLAREALRALTDAKLTPAQQDALTAATKAKPDRADLTARVLGKPFHAARPPATDTDAWLKYLDGPADADAGRRVFESVKTAHCAACHQVDGRGVNIGPDLSLIGRTERRWIVESILQPSAVVAPHYVSWKIEMADGRILNGLLVHTLYDESTYVNEKGIRFKVLSGDVAEAALARTSIMPDGLLDKLTDQEARDLLAFLASRK